MSEMIERVARALARHRLNANRAAANLSTPTDEQWNAIWEVMQNRISPAASEALDGYLDEARAAIEAMREPTEAMSDAGGAVEYPAFNGEDEYNAPIGDWKADEVWGAMIGTALRSSH